MIIGYISLRGNSSQSHGENDPKSDMILTHFLNNRICPRPFGHQGYFLHVSFFEYVLPLKGVFEPSLGVGDISSKKTILAFLNEQLRGAAKVTYPPQQRRSPVHMAATRKSCGDMINLLKKSGANCYAKDFVGLHLVNIFV